jgi:uncharacterized integral membrane protein
VSFLGRVLLAVLLALAIALSLVNREDVDLDLGAWIVTIPLFLLLISTLALGVLIGWLVGWFGAARNRHRARLEGRRAKALEERLAALERAASPSRSDALVSPRLPPHLDDD